MMNPSLRRFLMAASLTLIASQLSAYQFFSIAKEIALGDLLASETRRHTTPVDNEGIQQQVQRVAQRLIPYVKSPFPWTIEVVTGLSQHPTQEPLTLPGGHMFVPGSLILSTRNDDELAGMLAHAMAHIEARDTTRATSFNTFNSPGAIPLVFIGGWEDSSAMPLKYIRIHQVLELAADKSAIRILKAAGYNPAEFVQFIERVQPAGFSSKDVLPQRSERVAALRKEIQDTQ